MSDAGRSITRANGTSKYVPENHNAQLMNEIMRNTINERLPKMPRTLQTPPTDSFTILLNRKLYAGTSTSHRYGVLIQRAHNEMPNDIHGITDMAWALFRHVRDGKRPESRSAKALPKLTGHYRITTSMSMAGGLGYVKVQHVKGMRPSSAGLFKWGHTVASGDIAIDPKTRNSEFRAMFAKFFQNLLSEHHKMVIEALDNIPNLFNLYASASITSNVPDAPVDTQHASSKSVTDWKMEPRSKRAGFKIRDGFGNKVCTVLSEYEAEKIVLGVNKLHAESYARMVGVSPKCPACGSCEPEHACPDEETEIRCRRPSKTRKKA